MNTPPFESFAVHIHQIQSEYQEMPGLRLTREQAQRLWALDLAACVAALEYLVGARFLRHTAAGEYVRFTNDPTVSPLRTARAEGNRRVPGRDA
jgi:hypothetical protein